MSRRGRPLGPARFLDFAEIAEQAPYIRGVLRGLGLRAVDIDDVLQGVLLGAWRSAQAGRFTPRPDLKPSVALRIWLYGVAFRLASHERRRAHRRHEILMADPRQGLQEPTVEPTDWLGAREAMVAIWTLPLWAREVLMLAALGHSMADIANALGITLGAAAGRLRRTRLLLAKTLTRGGR